MNSRAIVVVVLLLAAGGMLYYQYSRQQAQQNDALRQEADARAAALTPLTPPSAISTSGKE